MGSEMWEKKKHVGLGDLAYVGEFESLANVGVGVPGKSLVNWGGC